MRPSVLFGLLALVLGAGSACGDDDPMQDGTSATITVAMTANMGAQGRVEMESKTFSSPQVTEGFRMSRLSFYLSEIALIEQVNGQDLATDLAEVAYVNFGPDGTAQLDFQQVPTGDYQALRFRLGLSAEQDATTPADYAQDSPLGRDSEYWFDWNSYIFLKVEGRSDTLADQVARFEVPFVYHVGRSEQLARVITVDYPVTIESSGEVLNLTLDVAQVLGLAANDGVSLAGGLDHANMEAVPLMNRTSTAFAKTE